MLRSCGKRLMVAMVGVAALAWIGAGLAVAQTSQKPVFARIVVSEKSVVYIQIHGDELRAAMSVEGLQTAMPGKLRSEIALPVPADQLPAGVTAIKVNLALMRVMTTAFGSAPAPYISGQLTVSRTDDQKTEWQYVSQVGVMAGSDAQKAPSIKLPNLDKVKATLETKPSRGKLAIGLRLIAGGATLPEVRKDGKPIQVQMSVTDVSGAVTASKVGTMAAFGFS